MSEERNYAGDLYHIADIIRSWESIMSLPNCNDCGRQPGCAYCPKPGQMVRYNCPLWSEDNHAVIPGTDLNELIADIADLEKERDYWHNLCQSYEQTIVKMAETIKNKGEHT